jgi:hypothetical protein
MTNALAEIIFSSLVSYMFNADVDNVGTESSIIFVFLSSLSFNLS